MRCPRCHSEDMIQIGRLTYCRHCISFGQIRPFDKSKPIPVKFASEDVHYELDYELSETQKEIAFDVMQALNQGQNVVIQAVCGSGKTELVYPSICSVLSQQKVVGFSLPRKDLAVEIYERLHAQMKGSSMCLVYGGHHDDCYQSLVVCTTHQLYRYWNYFDLLIIDEIDAFPFANDELLHQMALSACKGQLILMSATAFEGNLPANFKKFTLNRRYHGHDLPIPKLIWCPDCFFVFASYPKLKRLTQEGALCLVFVPERKDGFKLKRIFSKMGFKVDCVDSHHASIQVVLEAFRQHQINVLITTTILERGVTFENVHVFVYRAQHHIYTTSTLIQIAGRVGRKINYPDGEIYFFGKYISKSMKLCRKYLLDRNVV